MTEVKINVEEWDDIEKPKVGQLILFNQEVYQFQGYEFGTYPFAINIETDEQIELP